MKKKKYIKTDDRSGYTKVIDSMKDKCHIEACKVLENIGITFHEMTQCLPCYLGRSTIYDHKYKDRNHMLECGEIYDKIYNNVYDVEWDKLKHELTTIHPST
jgi:hypothetical protein